MAINIQVKKAVKKDAKGRVALVGPSGSGKTMSALRLARTLVGASGKILCVDTESGSMSKYAPVPGQSADNSTAFDFDVIELDSYSKDNFMAIMDYAKVNGYDAIVIDSISHFWMGKDGALQYVEMRKKATRDQQEGWKDWSPQEREMIEAIIRSPAHVIVTMRTKTEYKEEEYTNSRGERKTKRVKIGFAPVQRQGLEYEFDLVGYMDDENTFITDKSRCMFYTGKAISRPSEEDFLPFKEWLGGSKEEAQQVGSFSAMSQDEIHHKLQAALVKIRSLKDSLAATGESGLKSFGAVLSENKVKSPRDVTTVELAEKIVIGLEKAKSDLLETSEGQVEGAA